MSTSQLRQQSTKLGHFKSTMYIERPHHFTSARKRNNSSNLSAYQTIGDHFNRSDSQTFQSKILLQTNLPDIHSKKKSQKRSSLLEMWLDQALDPQENQQSKNNNGLRIEVDKTGPLRTVQKFEIDKKYLKSLNISQEAIDKIYNSLYVYTYGINNTFEEILKSTKVSQHSQKKIINNFWKAFIKLLEGCTSFRTCFQVIQEGHLKNLTEVKDTFIRREQNWNSQKQTLEQENLKLLKKINEQSYLLSKITNDYNISEATLQLTDQAFNEEVNLRLKFQQKVNAMFSSYEELRVKYDRLIQQLQFNKEQFSQFKKIEASLKMQLMQTTIRLDQTNKQLKRAYQVINQRQKQISLKRQEIFQLQGQINVLKQEKQKEQEQIRKIINKANNLKLLCDEYKAQANYKTIILAEVEKRLTQQDNIIMGCREANEKLYNQLEESGNTISNLQKQLIAARISQRQAQLKKEASQRYAKQNQMENVDLHSKIQNLEKQLSLAKDELRLKNKQIEKNVELTGDLQAVNSKFQTLYLTTSSEKKKMEQEMQEAIYISEKFKEQMQGMKLLLQSKTVQLQEANIKLQNQREVFRSKIAGQRQELETKEQQILQLHNKQIQDQELMKVCQKQAEDSKKLLQQYRNEIINLSTQKIQTNLRIEQIDRQRISKYAKIRDLQEQIKCLKKELLQKKQLLAQKEGVIVTTIGQSQAQNQQLRQLLEQYRQSREKKVGYIHPMLYEDCIQQINRLETKCKHLTQNKKQMQQTISHLAQDIQTKNVLCEQRLDRIKTLSTSLVSKQSGLSIMLVKQTEAQNKIHSLTQQYQKYKSQNECQLKKLHKQFQQLKNLNNKTKEQNSQNQQLLTQKSLQIQSLKEENRDLCQQLRQNEGQINLLQQRINQLQEQSRKNSSRAANITQQISRKKMVSQSEKSQKEQQKHQTSLNTIYQKDKEQIQSPKQIKHHHPQIPSFVLKKQTADKEVQTQKKYSHAHRFEVVSQPHIEIIKNEEEKEANKQENDQAILQPKKVTKKVQNNVREQQRKKVEAGQFKKALKFTFMRR